MKNEIKGERKKKFLSWTFLDEFHEYIGSATEKEGSEKKVPGSMEALVQAKMLQCHDPSFLLLLSLDPLKTLTKQASIKYLDTLIQSILYS